MGDVGVNKCAVATWAGYSVCVQWLAANVVDGVLFVPRRLRLHYFGYDGV